MARLKDEVARLLESALLDLEFCSKVKCYNFSVMGKLMVAMSLSRLRNSASYHLCIAATPG